MVVCSQELPHLQELFKGLKEVLLFGTPFNDFATILALSRVRWREPPALTNLVSKPCFAAFLATFQSLSGILPDSNVPIPF